MVALEAVDEAVTRMRKELQAMGRHFKAGGHILIEEDKHRLFWLTLGELQSALLKRAPGFVALQLNYPLSAWKAMFELADNTLSRYELEHTLLCHPGTGVSLINILPGGRDSQKESLADAVEEMFAACRETGGNLVVQRAPTDLKSVLPVWGEPGSDLPLMKRIRSEIDPDNLMNPGRFAADS